MNESTHWRKCASCKKEIPFKGVYQKCSVSSCRKHVYCSVDCWDMHLGYANHKSAWAEEERAPAVSDSFDEKPRRRIVVQSKTSSNNSQSSNVPMDILIVASKLKNYVKEKHGLNTSAEVMDTLSDVVRQTVDRAVDQARADGRKTLMSRDFI